MMINALAVKAAVFYKIGQQVHLCGKIQVGQAQADFPKKYIRPSSFGWALLH